MNPPSKKAILLLALMLTASIGAVLARPEPQQRTHRDVVLARADLGRFERARRQAALGAGDPTIQRAATDAIQIRFLPDTLEPVDEPTQA